MKNNPSSSSDSSFTPWLVTRFSLYPLVGRAAFKHNGTFGRFLSEVQSGTNKSIYGGTLTSDPAVTSELTPPNNDLTARSRNLLIVWDDFTLLHRIQPRKKTVRDTVTSRRKHGALAFHSHLTAPPTSREISHWDDETSYLFYLGIISHNNRISIELNSWPTPDSCCIKDFIITLCLLFSNNVLIIV